MIELWSKSNTAGGVASLFQNSPGASLESTYLPCRSLYSTHLVNLTAVIKSVSWKLPFITLAFCIISSRILSFRMFCTGISALTFCNLNFIMLSPLLLSMKRQLIVLLYTYYPCRRIDMILFMFPIVWSSYTTTSTFIKRNASITTPNTFCPIVANHLARPTVALILFIM